jgi:predicted DNA-binding transcriptional regulator YafY
VPTSHPRHSITETPALAAALQPLRERLGGDAPTLSELVLRGAEATLRELDARDRARAQARTTFVERLREASEPDLDEVRRVRHAVRTS